MEEQGQHPAFAGGPFLPWESCLLGFFPDRPVVFHVRRSSFSLTASLDYLIVFNGRRCLPSKISSLFDKSYKRIDHSQCWEINTVSEI